MTWWGMHFQKWGKYQQEAKKTGNFVKNTCVYFDRQFFSSNVIAYLEFAFSFVRVL